MPVYEIEHPKTGQKIRLEGEGMPSDSDIREAFAKVKVQPKDGRTPSYDNRVTDKAEIERGRREFVQGTGTLGTKVKESLRSAATPAEIPRFIADAGVATVNAGMRGLKSVASTVQGGGEAIRQGSINAGLQKYAQKQAEFKPMQSPLQPSGIGQAFGEVAGAGVSKLSDLTGRPDIVEPVAQGVMDIGALLGARAAAKPSLRALNKASEVSGSAARSATVKALGTPEDLARSALKPYIGESVARQQQATKGLKTAVLDPNASARIPKFLKRNLAEMEEIAGKQEVILSSKGNPAVSIQGIRDALKGTVDDARETPGTAEAAQLAAQRVLDDITNHPAYEAATDSIPLNTVQTMKRNIWKKLREGGTFNKDAVPGLQDAMWDSATGMNEIINKYAPEMAPENARYGELANVNKLLKRAADRHANNNIIPLRALIMLVRGDAKGFSAAASTWALDHPTFKLYIAQRMAKSGKKPTPPQVDATISSIKAELVKRDQTVLDSESMQKPSNSNLGDIIPN